MAVASLLGLISDDFLKYTRSRYQLTEDEEWNVLLDAHAKIVRSVERYDPERQSSTGWIVSITEELITYVLLREEAPLPEDHALWTEKREALQHALRRVHTSDLEILLDPRSRFGPTMTKAQKQALDHVRDLFNEIYYD